MDFKTSQIELKQVGFVILNTYVMSHDRKIYRDQDN